ncbi:glycoside hydrolase family 2 TIM barrel-domain containing protein [Flavivirga amylovorans]|uniref:Beta-glucuronidase n=1 Tax=Flavivirga amylovorans TaxID=870486 RepID=A0ABT8X0W3_9FLAO|nr:glycoside hydrolase family 2 TIM barrel-domain containing protein [Flavivirga amylovorans]MDO5987585.1 glycoside hydrolase family 2 TIM barrel-domain containing protein [Flavivirga amylovorans]
MDSRIIQNIDSRDKISLNGLWQTIIDPLENGYYNHQYGLRTKKAFYKNRKMKSPSDLIEYDFDSDYQLTVPGDWNTQMEKLYYYEGTIWYKKSFDFKKKTNSKVLLYFEAVNYQSIVYLNGKKLGAHVGGFTPFQFDVTDHLIEGENFIIVKVDNQRKKDGIPTLNMDWWNYGGITRSVHLINVPNSYISDYNLQINKQNSKYIEGWVAIEGAEDGEQVVVEIPELKKQISVFTTNGLAKFKIKASPKLWTPGNPKLYKVTLKSKSDKVNDDIGFRTIETKGSKILLNGSEIFLKGISIHEEAPFGLGRVSSKEECLILLNWAKELGCNFIRLAHYPHSETMIKEAEKMGFLIWSEIPVYWSVAFDNQETFANAVMQLEDMISRDKNRAAIILWSVANETAEGASRNIFLKKLTDKARKADASRLITAALNSQTNKGNEIAIEDKLGAYVDVIGINNYCGWYGGKPSSCADIKWTNNYDKPMIMSEVGAGALQGLHGEKNERWTEEYQQAVYENNIKMMKNIDFLSGSTPWILMDFRSPRRHLRRIQNDYNRKGIISEQGIKKKAFFTLKDFYLSQDIKD